MKKLNYFFWLILYKTIFEITYYYVISPNYSYYGLGLNISWNKFFISNILFLIMIVVIPKYKKYPSTYLVQLLFSTTVIPIMSYYWLSDQSDTYVFFVFISQMILYIPLRYKRRIKIPLMKKETSFIPKIVYLFLIISIIILGLFIINYGGIDIRAFNLNTVYDLRSDLKYTTKWIYLTNWLGKVFIPIIIIISIYQRRKAIFIVGIVMQILLYGSTGHKTFLLSIGLIIMFYYFISRGCEITIFAKIYTAIIFLSAFITKIFNKKILMSLFSVRMLSIPAWLNFIHYDFFSINQKLYFSEGMIGKIFNLKYPYSIPSTYLVSPSKSNANTGFLADAFDNGGLLVMLFFSLILSLILIYIDSIALKSHNKYIYTVFFVYPVIILNDSAMLTALLTSGILVILIFYYIFSSEENHTQKIIGKKL